MSAALHVGRKDVSTSSGRQPYCARANNAVDSAFRHLRQQHRANIHRLPCGGRDDERPRILPRLTYFTGFSHLGLINFEARRHRDAGHVSFLLELFLFLMNGSCHNSLEMISVKMGLILFVHNVFLVFSLNRDVF